MISALALAAFSFLFQEEFVPALRWDQSIDAALAAAKKDDGFVMIALPDDWPGEGHGGLSSAFWSHRGLLKAAAKGRAVVGSSCKHSENDNGSDRDGTPMDRVCSRFGQMLCEHHLEVEKQTIARFFEGQEPPVRPLFLFLRGSDGAVVARRLGDPTANELAELVKTVAASLDKEPVVPSELLGKVNDTDPAVRARVMRVIASLEFAAADAARKKLLEDAKEDARRAELLNAMAECGSRALQEVALAQTESKNSAVRTAALRALGGPGIASGADPLVKFWPKARDDEDRKAVIRALGRCARQSEPGRDLLKRALNDTKAMVRANAAVALGEAAFGDPGTVKLLKQKIESDPDSKARGAAVYALIHLRNVDVKETVAWIRARRPKEKDARVGEIMNSGTKYLEGSFDESLQWALTVFCGDPAK